MRSDDLKTLSDGLEAHHRERKKGRRYFFQQKSFICLKFGDGDGPNLCRVKKVDVSSTFIETIFRSGLTLVSS